VIGSYACREGPGAPGRFGGLPNVEPGTGMLIDHVRVLGDCVIEVDESTGDDGWRGSGETSTSGTGTDVRSGGVTASLIDPGGRVNEQVLKRSSRLLGECESDECTANGEEKFANSTV